MPLETLGPEDFGRGTKKRLPICFCLDVSGSMIGERMRKLNEAIDVFVAQMKDNYEVSSAADVGVITFGGYTDILKPMSQLSESDIPKIVVRERSLTPMGEAISLALDLLELRKKGYKEIGLKYYQPWLVLITDGKPEGAGALEAMDKALERLNELENDNKVVVFNIGIDDAVDFDILKKMSTKREKPINISSDDLSSLFKFLGSSSSQVINGKKGESLLYSVTDDISMREEAEKKVVSIDFDEYGDI